jgi:hypothetical protein
MSVVAIIEEPAQDGEYMVEPRASADFIPQLQYIVGEINSRNGRFS